LRTKIANFKPKGHLLAKKTFWPKHPFSGLQNTTKGAMKKLFAWQTFDNIYGSGLKVTDLSGSLSQTDDFPKNPSTSNGLLELLW